MEIIALIIAVISLLISVIALQRTGGIRELRRQVEALGSTTETVRDRTATGLERLGQLIRGRKDRKTAQGNGGDDTSKRRGPRSSRKD